MNPSRFHRPGNGSSSAGAAGAQRCLGYRSWARSWRFLYHPPRKTVLVVDDEPWLLDLYRLLLGEIFKARVFAVTNTASGLRVMHQSPPDLIISDINRPGLDGLEFTRRVRWWRLKVPVLIVSGALSEALAMAAWAAGATDCMAKPFAVRELVRLVRRHLTRRHHSRVSKTCAKLAPPRRGQPRSRPPTDPC